jgi:succinate dehydrogenase/fumarate reductase flavoprotein subunit
VFRSFKSFTVVAKRVLQLLWDKAVHGRSMRLSNGNALAARLIKSALDLDIPMYTSTEAVELLTRGGHVIGLKCRSGGGVKEIFARRGVVLACGGMAHDEERKRTVYSHARHGGPHYSGLADTDTGDGIKMGENVAAQFDSALLNAAGWVPVSLRPTENPAGRVVFHILDRSKPGFIAVTRYGRRFVNETDDYQQFGRALIEACAGEQETFCFLIGDHKTIRRYGIGMVKPAPFPLGSHIRSGYLLRGNTLEELARKAGIESAELAKTVAGFNKFAVNGADPEFGRGRTRYNRSLGDPKQVPNPCVAPIVQGPFYAVKLFMGDTGTFAGLNTDEYARALDKEGKPIAGLYVAGNDMHHVMGGDYLSGGATLGPALTFGYIAGCHLARPEELASIDRTVSKVVTSSGLAEIPR